MVNQALIDTFAEKARAVSAQIHPVTSMEEALDHVVQACVRKEACQVLSPGCEFPVSDPARELCELKTWEKLIAAPGLNGTVLESLAGRCREAGIGLIDRGLHAYTGGIDVGFTFADAGIAETGSLVLNCASEDLRLATMVSEVHIALLRAGDIYAQAYDLEAMLADSFSRAPGFTAFITGPSRTADIERVLSLGVHGPLALHVLILDPKEA